MTNATVSNTLPGPEPGGPRSTGAPARRSTMASASARPAVRPSGAGARESGRRHDGFAASLDASLDRAREARTDDDPHDAARAGSDRPERADESSTRRTATQPWWLRAQAERAATPDGDVDADQSDVTSRTAASPASGPSTPGADDGTGADAADASNGDQAASLAAAQSAAQLAAMMAAPVPAAAPAPTVDGSAGAPTDADDLSGATGISGGTDDLDALSGAAGVLDPQQAALPDGASVTEQRTTALAGEGGAGQAQAQSQPIQTHLQSQVQTEVAAGADVADRVPDEATVTALPEPSTPAHAPAHGARPGVRNGWAFQALKQAAAAVSGMTAGGSSASAGVVGGAAGQGGIGADARAAARAMLSAAADGHGTASAAVTGSDPSGEPTATGDPQAGAVGPSLMAASAGSGGETTDSDARDTRRGTSEPTIEFGARGTGAGGGSAPVFVPVPVAGSAAALAFSVPVTDAAPAGEIPEAADNLGRLIQSFRMQTREGLSEATVRLNPNHLGEVTIAIRVDKGLVTATVQAEAGSVRQWLQGQEDALRATLADQGLTLEHYAVEPDGQRRQSSPDDEPQAQARRRNRARQSDGRTFEVSA